MDIVNQKRLPRDTPSVTRRVSHTLDFGPRVFSQVSQLALQHFAADAMTLPEAAVLCAERSKDKEFDDIQGEGMAEIQKGEQTKPCREYQAGTCGNCKIWLQLRTYIISLRAPL